jgi:hypothetical protein
MKNATYRESIDIPVRTSEGGVVHIGDNNANGITYCGSNKWGHATRPAVEGGYGKNAKRFSKITCKKCCSRTRESYRAEVEAVDPKVALADGVSKEEFYA